MRAIAKIRSERLGMPVDGGLVFVAVPESALFQLDNKEKIKGDMGIIGDVGTDKRNAPEARKKYLPYLPVILLSPFPFFFCSMVFVVNDANRKLDI